MSVLEFIANGPLLAGIFGGWEFVLLLALAFILFGGSRRLPDLARGLANVFRGFSEGCRNFRKATDDLAGDAGRSVGGIYGKPAGQALTPDNQVAELYDPAVFDKNGRPVAKRSLKQLFSIPRLILIGFALAILVLWFIRMRTHG